jgi:uncharacterized membrane protein
VTEGSEQRRSAPSSPQSPPLPDRSDGGGGGGGAIAGVVYRNIQALMEVRRREEHKKTSSDKVADAITAFAGSMWCVYVHAAVFGFWIAANVRLIPGIKAFDPFPFVMLAMAASVEAIFLSTFILISQNRMQLLADRRAELDLQISLLTEHELTRAISLLDNVAKRLHSPRPPEPELQEIKQDIRPERVVEEIEKAQELEALHQRGGGSA